MKPKFPSPVMNHAKAVNFLAHSQRDVSIRHQNIAQRIKDLIDRQEWRLIAKELKYLSDADKELLHYAFFDLYGFDYELKIRKEIGSYSTLKEYGLV